MNPSLVICLLFAVTIAMTAATAAVLAGWSWLAALGLYSGVGSFSLVIMAVARAAAPEAAPIRNGAARRAEEDDPAYA